MGRFQNCTYKLLTGKEAHKSNQNRRPGDLIDFEKHTYLKREGILLLLLLSK